MAILVHRYDSPDRFVAGTVGQPGERTFFLQAREGNRITSVGARSSRSRCWPSTWTRCSTRCCGAAPAADVPPAAKARDFDPLDAPITEEFRFGTMTIAWGPRSTGS